MHTPELTGQGAYAKAWMREDDGLYLYKASTVNGNESAIEAEVSNILDYTNVPHVHYELMFLNNLEVCRCKNMCNDSFSIVPAGDISSWCSRAGIKFDDYVVGTDPENFYKTVVVDYLVSNSDRHINNWGFYMNNKNGNIESMHPLFDHNNAFDPGDMASKDGGESMMMPGLSKKEAAELAIKSCHFKINEPIPLSVFIDRSHEDSFMERASSLGLLPQSRGSDKVFVAGKTDKGR